MSDEIKEGAAPAKALKMDGSKPILTLRWLLAMATFFIALTYISRPADNQCQMTFMMEPPRFVPIPIDKQESSSIGDEKLDIQSKKSQYTLFMYSEYGFPMESDLRRDLRDSMPVLFVPGNAGSYQQVRSLASTCIRRQLQSLDAFKFIFYTIDFKAQLSGISGKLVHDQIAFVDSALQKISKMHSMDTNGVIVIGHSVGGFIAKALLARNGFDHGRVPLLISLASPLTKSFVNFDEQMSQLISETDSYWSRRPGESETLAISISGGKSDRLVPMHLSLDPQYDLSLTTSSIRDVWLTTDHVSITWCRELVQKLAQLLSVMMDKKHTRLIIDKNIALDKLRGQLQTEALKYIDVDHVYIPKGKRVIGTRDIDTLENHISIRRNHLLDGNKVLNLTGLTEDKLLIWIEHIDSVIEKGIYSCRLLLEDSGQTFCEGKLNLMGIAQTIPSRRYEPKKKLILIANKSRRINYVVFEFASRSKPGVRTNQVPEIILIQSIKEQEVQSIHIPTLTEYMYHKVFSPETLNVEINFPEKVPIAHSKKKVTNLIHTHQFYSLAVETKSCPTDDKTAETLVLLNRAGLVEESFHPDKTTSAVIAKLSSQKTILSNHRSDSRNEIFLDFFLDGACKTHIRIHFDWWGLMESTIQQRATEILTCATYSAYSGFVSLILNFVNQGYGPITTGTCWFVGLIVVYTSSTDLANDTELLDQVILLVSISLLSIGLVALIENFIKRMLDLGIIALKFTTFIRDKVKMKNTPNQNSRVNGSSKFDKPEQIYLENKGKVFGFSIAWSVICVVMFASTILSEALMRICIIFMITLLQIRLTGSACDGTNSSTHNTHVEGLKVRALPNDKLALVAQLYPLLVSIATLCALSSIANIPSLLLELSNLDMDLSASLFRLNFAASAASLALIKIICDQLESLQSRDRWCETGPATCNQSSQPLPFLLKQSYVIALLPIAFIRLNICYMNCAEFVALLWAAIILIKENATVIKKTKID